MLAIFGFRLVGFVPEIFTVLNPGHIIISALFPHYHRFSFYRPRKASDRMQNDLRAALLLKHSLIEKKQMQTYMYLYSQGL